MTSSIQEPPPEASASAPPTARPRRIPLLISFGLPVGMVVAQFLLKGIDRELYRTWMRGEFGLVENITVLALIVAATHAVLLFRRRNQVRWRLFGPFALVMALGCIFFGGEEMSWGQHWLGFEPPEAIAERNEQGEFNLHNDPLLETVLDQLPRNLLTVAALVGGVLAPLIRRRRHLPPDFQSPGPWGWIWPDKACLPAALLAVAVTLPEKVAEAFTDDVPAWLDISAGETKELCLGLFLMIYLRCLYVSLKASRGE